MVGPSQRGHRRLTTGGARVVALLGLLVTAAASPARAVAPSWSKVSSPDDGTADNSLADVSRGSATSCQAVGAYENSDSVV